MRDDWQLDEENEYILESKKSRKIVLIFIVVLMICLIILGGVIWHYVSEFFASLCGAADCD